MKSIDLGAHVIEFPYTREFMDAAVEKYAPVLLTQTLGASRHGNDGAVVKEFWLIDKTLNDNARTLYGLD